VTRRNPDNAPIPGVTPDQIVDAARRLADPHARSVQTQPGQGVNDALVFLGLADRDGASVILTPKGHALAESTTPKQQRQVFSTAAATVPLIRDITRRPSTTRQARLPADRPATRARRVRQRR
jgi:hypothetical protein